MARSKYRFNANTLKYEKIKLSPKRKFGLFLKYFVILLNIAIVINLVLYSVNKNPKLLKLKKENTYLVNKLSTLNDNIENINNQLADIQQRDDNLYRPIFDIDPISNSIRMAGFGGTYNYEKLEGFNSSPLMINITQDVEEIVKQVYIQSRSYDQVIEKAMEKENFIECRPGIKPISDNDYIRISDYFGWRKDPFSKKATVHHGIDFAGDRGGKVHATGKGIVIKAGYSLFGYGRIVEIDHGFGYKTRYAHLDKIFVKEGDKVNRSETIGLLGNSGRSTGPHLHYEVRMNNKPVNPQYFFNNDISAEEYDKMIAFYLGN